MTASKSTSNGPETTRPSGTVKDRVLAGIGDRTIERPRQLQQDAGTNEHHVVHVLYALQKQGLVDFKKRRSAYSPGVNLTNIRLTPEGRKKLGKP